MIKAKILKKIYKFDTKVDLANTVIDKFNGKHCKCCKEIIDINYDSLYNKIKHGTLNFPEYRCNNCLDGRVVQLKVKVIWKDKKNNKHSKTFYTKNQLTQYFKNINFYCKCGKKLEANDRFSDKLYRYINSSIIDTTKWQCQKCSAYDTMAEVNSRTDKEFVERREKNARQNGKKSAKKTQQTVMNNPKERKRRSKQMKDYNKNLTDEEKELRSERGRENLEKFRKEQPKKFKRLVKKNGKDIHTQNKRARNNALNRYKNLDKLTFYMATISEDNTVYKIGITRDLKRRKKLFGIKQYTWARSLLYDDTEKIIELEYQAKEMFQIHNYERGTEFIYKTDLKKLKQFIKEFKY